jgi:DNA-binding MarR family transcriptional regulator
MSPTQTSQHYHQIINQIMRIGHAVKRQGCVVFQAENLHPRQLQLLFFLAQATEPVCGGTLVEKLRITPGAVTQLTGGLVEQGLINRVNQSSDRRQVHYVLTPLAKNKLSLLKKKQQEKLMSSFMDLSEAELKTLLELLQRIGIKKESTGSES